MRYLGIDYGKRKIGLAVSEGQIASPLKVLEVSSLKDALEKVGRIIEVEKIDRVVIGVPESGEAKSIVKKFIEGMKNNEKVKIIETEETLSSVEAREFMIELGLGQKMRQEEDAYSAVLILQRFLNSLS